MKFREGKAPVLLVFYWKYKEELKFHNDYLLYSDEKRKFGQFLPYLDREYVLNLNPKGLNLLREQSF